MLRENFDEGFVSLTVMRLSTKANSQFAWSGFDDFLLRGARLDGDLVGCHMVIITVIKLFCDIMNNSMSVKNKQKKVLITGRNSYVGKSVKSYLLKKYGGMYEIDQISVRGEEWKKSDFSRYDVIYHVAGIAHSDNGKISKEKGQLYYRVNTDLTGEVARKAKADGVSQFIFMSSAIVYGDSAKIGKDKIIRRNTKPSPKNCYGDSKLKAEEQVERLADSKFKTVIIRSPMIYGKGCKGNFAMLVKMAKKLPIFPYVENRRSMIYIDNLAEFIHQVIQNNDSGMFWPANKEYVNTSSLIKEIGMVEGKRIRLVKGFTWFLKFLSIFSALPTKAFGNLRYEKSLTEYGDGYQTVSFEKSISEAVK